MTKMNQQQTQTQPLRQQQEEEEEEEERREEGEEEQENKHKQQQQQQQQQQEHEEEQWYHNIRKNCSDAPKKKTSLNQSQQWTLSWTCRLAGRVGRVRSHTIATSWVMVCHQV